MVNDKLFGFGGGKTSKPSTTTTTTADFVIRLEQARPGVDCSGVAPVEAPQLALQPWLYLQLRLRLQLQEASGGGGGGQI